MNTQVSDDGLRLSEQLCFAAYAAANAFKSIYKPLLDPIGLTYPQYLVLLVLVDEDNLDALPDRQAAIPRLWYAYALAERLEASGVVRDATRPTNGWFVFVSRKRDANLGDPLQRLAVKSRAQPACRQPASALSRRRSFT